MGESIGKREKQNLKLGARVCARASPSKGWGRRWWWGGTIVGVTTEHGTVKRVRIEFDRLHRGERIYYDTVPASANWVELL